MKKIILSLVMLISTATFSQKSIGLFTEASEPSTIGLSFEYSPNTDKDGYFKTKIFNVGYSAMDYGEKIGGKDIVGTGYTLQLGTRYFLNKGSKKGFFTDDYLIYSNIKFDEYVYPIGNVTGKYRYWSLINPLLGYRFEIGKLVIDPSIGFNWKWEVRGKGIVDNKNYDNFIFKAGIRLAYKL